MARASCSKLAGCARASAAWIATVRSSRVSRGLPDFAHPAGADRLEQDVRAKGRLRSPRVHRAKQTIAWDNQPPGLTSQTRTHTRLRGRRNFFGPPKDRPPGSPLIQYSERLNGSPALLRFGPRNPDAAGQSALRNERSRQVVFRRRISHQPQHDGPSRSLSAHVRPFTPAASGEPERGPASAGPLRDPAGHAAG